MILIDKEELMNDLNISWSCSGCKNDSGSFCKLEYDVTKVCEKIRNAKEQEIIRCKDCKYRKVNEHYGEKGYMNLKAICELDTGDIFQLGRYAEEDDWFCADAERREGDADAD